MDTSTQKKVNRKPNWTSDECLSLVQLVESNKDVIRGKFSSKLTSEHKRRTWASITDSLNASHPHVVRSQDEIEKKWYNLLSKSRQEMSNYRRGLTGTGGGPSTTPLSAVATTVESILGSTNVSICGIDSGPGLDSTLLQFINISASECGGGLDLPVDNTVPCSVGVPFAVSVPVQSTSVVPVQATTVPVQVTDRKKELELKVLEAQLEYYQLKIKKMKKD